MSQGSARASARREVLTGEHDDAAPASRPDPEKLTILKEEHARKEEAWATLCDSFRSDAVCQLVLALYEEGVLTPAEQAARAGVSVSKIYDARERIHRAALRLNARFAPKEVMP
jgi:hypothetical protein